MNTSQHINDTTLLDHYAGLAMQAIITKSADRLGAEVIRLMASGNDLTISQQVAKMAFEMAAAMMAERARLDTV